jgi:hypothetical protein
VYELYRCLYHITGGKSIIHSEYPYTAAGRIDLFLKNRQWGIEALKDGTGCRNTSIVTVFKESAVLGELYRNTFS